MAYTIYRVKLHFFIKVAYQGQLVLPASKMKETKWKEAATTIFLNSVKFHVSSGFISVKMQVFLVKDAAAELLLI